MEPRNASLFSHRPNQRTQFDCVCDRSICGREGSQRERHCQILKLTMLSVMPGLILILRNTISLVDSVEIFQSNTYVKRNVKISTEISQVIHAIQKERGTTALYISSDGDPFVKPRLLVQYHESDLAIGKLSKWIPMEKPDYFLSRYTFHKNIHDMRSILDPHKVTLQETIKFYSDIISVFVKMIGKSVNIEAALTYWTDLVAYQMLVASKEEAGIERALGSTYYARGKFPREDLMWYREKNILGKSFLDQCLRYSSYVSSLMESMYLNSVLAEELSVMRAAISRNNETLPSVVSGTLWFDNMTNYINILKTVQDKLALRIIDKTFAENMALEQNMIISALELVLAIVLVPIITVFVKKIVKKIQVFSSELRAKTVELEQERRRTEGLLYQLLPRTVARKLIDDGTALPEAYHCATIMFSDIVGFTGISSRSTPMQVVNMLNKLYMAIDERLENFDVYKVMTIGDGYMVASGLPSRNGERHVEEIAKLSLDLLKMLEILHIPHLQDETLRLRIGFNSGPCVAGVVGIRMPRYCVFGDTVNTASRMETSSLPLRIQMTEASALKLRQLDGYEIAERGHIEIKGKGMMRTFWLEGYTKPSYQADRISADSHRVVIVKEASSSDNKLHI